MRAVRRTETIDSLLELKSLFHSRKQHNNPVADRQTVYSLKKKKKNPVAVSNNADYKLK